MFSITILQPNEELPTCAPCWEVDAYYSEAVGLISLLELGLCSYYFSLVLSIEIFPVGRTLIGTQFV